MFCASQECLLEIIRAYQAMAILGINELLHTKLGKLGNHTQNVIMLDMLFDFTFCLKYFSKTSWFCIGHVLDMAKLCGSRTKLDTKYAALTKKIPY